MIKYSKGFRHHLAKEAARLRFRLKTWCGKAVGYPVYRPPIDHSVYREDNRALGSTTLESAKLIHQVSCSKPPSRPALIEFEHPFALMGHVDAKTDYVDFRSRLNERWREVGEWADPDRYRLVATTRHVAAAAKKIIPRPLGELDRLIDVLPWGMQPQRTSPLPLGGKLRVFHSGGLYPAAKGTLDVLAVARQLPEIDFHINVDCAHPLLPRRMPDNVEVSSMFSRRQYLAGLRSCHVLLYPLYGDGWGVILDAMAHAMPVVMYNTFDKEEAVLDGVTGSLVPLPSTLSFYDGFMSGEYANWSEYNDMIASSSDAARIELLSGKIGLYKSREYLDIHGFATVLRFADLHAPQARILRIKEIYSELLKTSAQGAV